MKVKMVAQIGECKKEAIYTLPDDFTEDEINEEWSQWKNENIDGCWEILE